MRTSCGWGPLYTSRAAHPTDHLPSRHPLADGNEHLALVGVQRGQGATVLGGVEVHSGVDSVVAVDGMIRSP